MFVLNDILIKDYQNRGWLKISDNDWNFLHGTYYYFRLGRHYRLWNEAEKCFENGRLDDSGANSVIILPSKGYANIVSYERFMLTDKVNAIFSQVSDISLSGMQLNHSSFIDPCFDGNLEFGIQNLLNSEQRLVYGMPLGKVQFIDVSDTYPINPPSNTRSKDKYDRRKHNRDESDDDFEFPKTLSQADFT